MKKISFVLRSAAALCVALFCVKFIEVQAQESAASSPVPETVELRMLVVDDKDYPVPNTLVRLKIFGGREFSWTTNEEGRVVGNIPLEWIMWDGPEVTSTIINREKALTDFPDVYNDGLNIPKDWKLGDPIEMTYVVYKRQRITGFILDQDGKPVADASVYCEYHTTTDKEGRFELFAMMGREEPPILVALHPTLGFGGIYPDVYPDPYKKKPGEVFVGRGTMLSEVSNATFKLEHQRSEPFRVKVVNPEGNPIEGAIVSLGEFSPIEKDKEAFLKRVAYEDFAEVPTDRDGMAAFHWLPPVKEMTIKVRGTDPREHKASPARFYGAMALNWQAERNDATPVIQLPRMIMLEGSVRFEDGSIPEQRPLRYNKEAKTPGLNRMLSRYLSGQQGTSLSTDYNGNFVFFEYANTVVSLYPTYYDPYAPEGMGIYYQPRSDKPVTAPAMLRVNVGDGTKPPPRFDFILKPGAKVSGELPYHASGLQIWEMSGPDDTKIDNMNRRYVFEIDDIKREYEYEILLPPGWYRFILPGAFDEDPVCDAVLEIREEDRNKNVRFDFDAEGKGTVTREPADDNTRQRRLRRR